MTCLSLSEADVVTLHNTGLLHWQVLRYRQDSIYINVSSVWTAIFKSERGENSPHGTRTVQHIHRQETVCSRLKHDTSYAERMSYRLSVCPFLKRFTNTKEANPGSFMSERCCKCYEVIDSYSLKRMYSTVQYMWFNSFLCAHRSAVCLSSK